MSSGASIGAGFNFSCNSDSGASLITRFESTVEKSFYPNVIGKHFTKYRLMYFDMARALHLPINHPGDIFVVSGRVMTGDWAIIAFHNRSQEASASFNIKAMTITGSGTIWGKWSEHVNYPRRHGPTRRRALSDSEEPNRNQCIFIDTIREYERTWYEKMKALVNKIVNGLSVKRAL